MFFLIRCAFWLTIVFYAMPWPQTASAPDAGQQNPALKIATGLARDLASAAGAAVRTKLEEECLKAPDECLAAAARLPQIVATAGEAVRVIPPKRPLKLAESGEGRAAAVHKAVPQRD